MPNKYAVPTWKKKESFTKGDNVSVITLFETMFQLERVNARSRWHNPTKLYAWTHTNVKRCVWKFLSTKCQIRGSPEEKIPVDCNHKIQLILRDLFHSQLEQPCKHFHNPCYSLTDWLSVLLSVSSNSWSVSITICCISVVGTSAVSDLFNLVRKASNNLLFRWSVCVISLVGLCSLPSEFSVPRVSFWIFCSEFSSANSMLKNQNGGELWLGDHAIKTLVSSHVVRVDCVTSKGMLTEHLIMSIQGCR